MVVVVMVMLRALFVSVVAASSANVLFIDNSIVIIFWYSNLVAVAGAGR